MAMLGLVARLEGGRMKADVVRSGSLGRVLVCVLLSEC